MKFFKFLLQILAMGLCFVAGMVYEKNLLQNATPDAEMGISIEDNKNDDIIIDAAPMEEQNVIDKEFDFDGNNTNVNGDIVNDGTVSNSVNDINTMDMDAIKLQDDGNQQSQPTEQDQAIIINDVEPAGDNTENGSDVIQPIQLPNNEVINDLNKQ